MTVTEITKRISESENADWFKSISVILKYPHLNEEITLKGATSIYRYVSNQAKGWSEFDEPLPNELLISKNYFETLRRSIANFIESHSKGINNNLDYYWNNDIQRKVNNPNGSVFNFDSPETEFLLKLFFQEQNLFTGAYNYIIGSINFNSKQSFLGAMLAYEFTQKNASEITKRRTAEKPSITRMKNDFELMLSEVDNQLITHLKDSSDKFQEYTKTIDEFKGNKEKLFNDWFINTKGDFKTFNSDSNTKIKDLENTYEELLRLKKPAAYWKDRATTLKAEGWKSTYILTALVVIACVTLYCLLWLTPEGMLASFLKGESSAIRWSVVYITFISFLAFGIRTLNKIAFSSFHLARDAEEREQLTHVYLALIKEEGIDEKDRHLIMQSLFSRADTGLLKEDSSPTMPSDFAGKLMNR
ncbi:DUF6161 domain-containing protein [Pontibacter toksunensis]|uniref:DUF6161 domain-containing protein n=1 Tax=Pontibacter toksunensis TaxID=1332631 RepID=A0ABW6C2B3_9BACT